MPLKRKIVLLKLKVCQRRNAPLSRVLTTAWRWLQAAVVLALLPSVLFAQSAPTSSAGSVPLPSSSQGSITLTFSDAIQTALKQNLAIVEADQNVSQTRAQRLLALSSLLPSINGSVSEHVSQINLATYGIQIPGLASIQGPFQYQDARATITLPILSAPSIQSLRSARRLEEAAALSASDVREAVVLVVGTEYLAVVQAHSHVKASNAQVMYAEALHQQAQDAFMAGTGSRIDETRTAVQLETERYNLLAAQNSLRVLKITLARSIGLPPSQEFDVVDTPLAKREGIPSLESLLAVASRDRADLVAAERTVAAAQLSLSSAKTQRLPAVSSQMNYGAVGKTFTNSHGTFDFAGGINFPIFTGGRLSAQIEQSKALLDQRTAELQNLRAQVDADVRTAYFNLETAEKQVQVATRSVELANDDLARSRDRFANGVTDSVEVVQAQQALAAANDQMITSSNSLNSAALNLARATGSARSNWHVILGGN